MSNFPIEEVYRNALALDPSERASYLDTACGADTALKQAVKVRLDSQPSSHSQHCETMVGNAQFALQDAIPEIPNYKIRSVLGRGGMGVVYRADQIPLHRQVAIKMLSTQGPPTNEQLARFHAEAAALARVRHANIVEIYDYGEWQTRPYFVMELVEGQSLAAQAEGRPQAPRFAAHLMMIVARAVQAVNQQGILHRDLKPGNILLQNLSAEDPDKTIDPMTSVTFESRVLAPKITDFGVAKDLLSDQQFTLTGTTVGTPQYMAPEQAESEYQALGPATDVYGLGATLYELLTGQPPIRGATPLETLAHIATHEPPPPSSLQPGVPRDLDVICGKCLEKLPSRRYATAQALADDLQCYLEQRPIKARPTGSFVRVVRWCRRHPLPAGFAALSCLLAGALLVSMVVYSSWLATALGSAKRNAEESHLRLIKLFTLAGMRDVEEGAALNGLLWFSEALLEDNGGAEATRCHRTRFATTYGPAPHLNYLWGGTDRLSVAAVSPGGRWAGLADLGGGVRIWEVASGRLVAPPLKLASPLVSLALSSDGMWAAGIDKEGVIRLWRPASGEAEPRSIQDAATIRMPFVDVIFHPKGKFLIVHQRDETLRLWDLAESKWRPIPNWPAQPPVKVALSVDGSHAVTIGQKTEKSATGPAAQTFTAQVWDILEGPVVVKPMLLTGEPREAVVNNDGSRLAVVESQTPAEARIWDVKTGVPLPEPAPQPGSPEVLKMVFNPQGDLLLTSSSDHRGRFWNTKTGALVFVGLPHRSEVLKIAFSTDGNKIATGGMDNQARVWDLPRGGARTPMLQHQESLRFVAFGHNDEFLLTADGYALRVWKINPRLVPQKAAPVKPPYVGFKETTSPDSSYRLVINGESAQVLDAVTGKPIGAPLVHASNIFYACFSPDSRLVATASEDNTARIWLAATGELLTTPMVHDGDVVFVAFSPDGKEIVTTSRDRTARLWDVLTGEPLSPPWIHEEPVIVASFSPDGLQVITREIDGNMYTWDISPDRRPAEIIQLWAQVLSGAHFVHERGEVPLESASLFKVWKALQEKLGDRND